MLHPSRIIQLLVRRKSTTYLHLPRRTTVVVVEDLLVHVCQQIANNWIWIFNGKTLAYSTTVGDCRSYGAFHFFEDHNNKQWKNVIFNAYSQNFEGSGLVNLSFLLLPEIFFLLMIPFLFWRIEMQCCNHCYVIRLVLKTFWMSLSKNLDPAINASLLFSQAVMYLA